MQIGYKREQREQFFTSGTFAALKPLIKTIADLHDSPQGNIVDEIGKKQADEFVRKMCKVIGVLYLIVEDCRADIDAMKEASKNGRH